MPLAVDDFLTQSETLPVIDVRSPGEFAHALALINFTGKQVG
jgi:tRNA 2-selenouridine synthase